MASTVDLSPILNEDVRASLQRLGARLVRFVSPEEAAGMARPTGPQQVAVDADGFYLPWLREAGLEVIVVRPDFYIFGAAATAAELPALLDELFAKLDLTPEPLSGRPSGTRSQ